MFELRRHGYDASTLRVASASGLRDALGARRWDLVLSDHNLPGFESPEGLLMIQDADPDLPVVVLSGTIGEEATVEALRSGARDVVLKSNLRRIGLVVDRVLDDAEQRRRHRRAEAELVESAERMAAMLASALDCIITIDEGGRIVDFNPAAEEAFGYRQEAVRGRKMVELLIPPSFRRRHLERFEHQLATGTSTILGSRTELTAMRADGSEFPIEIAITRSDLAEGPFFTAYVRDLTALKEAERERETLEQQLRQAHKMEAIGSLASGIAHDFNNILTVIRGASSLMLRQDAGRYVDLARQIDMAAAQASELTQQLLAFSRQQVLKPQVLDLNDVVEESLQVFGRVIGEHVELTRHLGDSLGRILVDHGQLHQVILNLLVNARDAMPGGGTLTIRTASAEIGEEGVADEELRPGSYALLEVADSGIGMSEDAIRRAFEPFYTTKEEGTGLGLATVYGIVAQSGGHITLSSEPGAGTTVAVYFPLTEVESVAVAESIDVGPLEGDETILLVEDSELVRPLVVEVLESFGYTVLAAADGFEALAIAAENRGRVDLLLSDVVMPGMTGRELADKLREDDPDLKVLFTSGYPSDRVLRNGIAEALVAFIHKPYLADDLARAIRGVLGAPGGGAAVG